MTTQAVPTGFEVSHAEWLHMPPSLRSVLRTLTFFIFAWLAFCPAHAASIASEEEMAAQSFDDRFTTNWLAAVRAALPANYQVKNNFDFTTATNYLCIESGKGNVAAQALWGFTLIVLRASPETAATGLKLLRDSAEKGWIPAMINLGYLAEAGKYIRQDYNEAFRWFERAATLGIGEAQLQLGCGSKLIVRPKF